MSKWLVACVLALSALHGEAPAAPAAAPVAARIPAAQVAAAKQALLAKYPARKADIERGVDQVAKLWRTSDGDLTAFCLEQFAPDTAARDALFARLEAMF